MSKPFKVRLERIQEFTFPIERLWELLANTNRLNRRIGLPAISFSPPSARRGNVYQEVTLRTWFGALATWKEFPFEWVRHQRYSIYREFDGRFLTSFRAGLELSPAPYGTRATIYIEIASPRRWTLPFFRWGLARLLRRTLRFVSDSLQHHTSDLPLPTTTHRRNDAKLAEKLSHFRVLGDATRPEVSCLRLHLLEADDTELRGMRPFALADQWQTDRDKTLSLFLHATCEGLLEMDWEVLCPNCRVPKAQFKSLRDLSPKIHCELCQIGFEADLDRFIELRFNVAPSVRAASNALYCIGSPNRFPHVLVQANLAPRESRMYSINLPAEPLRCRTIKSNVSLEIEPEAKSGVTEVKLTFDGKMWKSNSQVFRPGSAVIAIANESDSPATVDLEGLVWKSQAVTAAYVTCLQEFRSLFALEILAPDKQVGVRSITILFSDLKASTELYERIGDAPAFSRVQRHFDYVLGIVERHHGAVVKTMGDAVMAVFSDPGQALEAALTIQSGLEGFCRTAEIEPSLSVKLGIHCGSAISLNANGTLDYFGRTINIAARLQAKSEGDDIVVSSEFLEDERVRAALARLPIPLRPFRSRLKGIDGDQLLYHMRLNRKPAARRAA